MYVTFEGVKGTGKTSLMTTLLPLLTELCQQKSLTFTTLYPTKPMPDTHPLECGAAVWPLTDTHRDKLYGARSNYHAKLVDWHTDLIVSDRSIFTSFAIRWQQAEANGVSLEDHCAAVRAREYLIAIPDIVIYLHASKATLIERYNTRQRSYGCDEETAPAIDRIGNSFDTLRHWSNSQPAVLDKQIHWYSFDTDNLSIQCLTAKVLDIIKHFLRQHTSKTTSC